ncbi:hypothetical protein HHK36_008917 [Tetracentron sinense]|uniref:N-acetyltransferase domain-containing protein n=1 Tax=Tetracentron sinense TaxID=13715 RepID=A0A834ZED3_TETSI|nr:hypothetical protein HHK36_008917 [Tetracentron sinense]
MNQRKLLLHDKVEVRQFEEGLRGSWHPGVVVSVSDSCRYVEYNELLSETGVSKLVECIPVTNAVEGLCRRRRVPLTNRGHIRPPPPSPPPDTCKPKLNYGLCVDAFYEDAWWEGVVFDRDESSHERSVFFPDEGDERKFNVRDLRVSCEWDEFLGGWRDRGVWVLMKLSEELEQDGSLPLFVKNVWSCLRLNAGFVKVISQWTCGVPSLWNKYLMDVIFELMVESSQQPLGPPNLSDGLLRKRRNKSKNYKQADDNLQLYAPNVQRGNCNDLHIDSSSQNRIRRASPDRTKHDMRLVDGSGRRKSTASDMCLEDNHQSISKRRNSKKPQKTKVNMLPQALVIWEGICDDFPNDLSGQSKGKLSPVLLPKQKKQSVKLKLNSEKPPVEVLNAKKNGFLVDNSCGERNMITDASLLQSNVNGEGNNDGTPIDCSLVPSQKRQSLKFKIKIGKPKPPIICEGKDNRSLVVNLSGGKEMTSDDSRMQSNGIGQGNCSGFTNNLLGQSKGNISRVNPKQKQQSVKKRLALEKSKARVFYKAKDNRYVVDRREKELTPDVLLAQDNHSVNERKKMRKPNQINLVTGFPICSPKKRNGKASCVIIKQSNCLVTGKRGLKKFQLSNVNVKSQSKEEEKTSDVLPKQDEECVTRRRWPLPFANFDKKVRLKDMVSRPRKRKKKRGYRRDWFLVNLLVVVVYGYGGLMVDFILVIVSSFDCVCAPCKELIEVMFERCNLGNNTTISSIAGLSSKVCVPIENRSSPRIFLRGNGVVHLVDVAYVAQGITIVTTVRSLALAINAHVNVFARLRQLLGKSNPTTVEGLSWTIMRSRKNDCYVHDTSKIDIHIELSRALNIMHQCFEPVNEPHTKRDLVVDVIFNRVEDQGPVPFALMASCTGSTTFMVTLLICHRLELQERLDWSKLKRLDFRGFYTMILQKGDEMISVATVRIHGQRVAEMPLVATNFQYRRQGMCRVLMNELEKMLSKMGIERLVLPAIPQLIETWKTSFGFIEMPLLDRLELLGHPFLGFQGTMMCQKFLGKSTTRKETRGAAENPGHLVPDIAMEYQVSDCKRKFCGLYYKRKSKTKFNGKENKVKGSNGSLEKYKRVYKRRRILANKDSSMDQ